MGIGADWVGGGGGVPQARAGAVAQCRAPLQRGADARGPCCGRRLPSTSGGEHHDRHREAPCSHASFTRAATTSLRSASSMFTVVQTVGMNHIYSMHDGATHRGRHSRTNAGSLRELNDGFVEQESLRGRVAVARSVLIATCRPVRLSNASTTRPTVFTPSTMTYGPSATHSGYSASQCASRHTDITST
jgi:hypothetical protein